MVSAALPVAGRHHATVARCIPAFHVAVDGERRNEVGQAQRIGLRRERTQWLERLGLHTGSLHLTLRRLVRHRLLLRSSGLGRSAERSDGDTDLELELFRHWPSKPQLHDLQQRGCDQRGRQLELQG